MLWALYGFVHSLTFPPCNNSKKPTFTNEGGEERQVVVLPSYITCDCWSALLLLESYIKVETWKATSHLCHYFWDCYNIQDLRSIMSRSAVVVVRCCCLDRCDSALHLRLASVDRMDARGMRVLMTSQVKINDGDRTNTLGSELWMRVDDVSRQRRRDRARDYNTFIYNYHVLFRSFIFAINA